MQVWQIIPGSLLFLQIRGRNPELIFEEPPCGLCLEQPIGEVQSEFLAGSVEQVMHEFFINVVKLLVTFGVWVCLPPNGPRSEPRFQKVRVLFEVLDGRFRREWASEATEPSLGMEVSLSVIIERVGLCFSLLQELGHILVCCAEEMFRVFIVRNCTSGRWLIDESNRAVIFSLTPQKQSGNPSIASTIPHQHHPERLEHFRVKVERSDFGHSQLSRSRLSLEGKMRHSSEQS